MFNLFKATEATQNNEAQASQKVSTDTRPKWKALAAERKITYEDMAALAIYRSMVKGEGKEGAISRLHKSFKPITNTVKLENGARPYLSLYFALWLVKKSTFISWLTEEEKQEMLAIAKSIKISGKEIT